MVNTYYIPEVEKEVEAVDRELLNLYSLLAEQAHPHGYTRPGNDTLYRNFLSRVEVSEHLLERIETLQGITQEMKDGTSRIERLKTERKESQSRVDLAYSRLGAIFWEESTGDEVNPLLVPIAQMIAPLQNEMKALREKKETYSLMIEKGGVARKAIYRMKQTSLLGTIRNREKKRRELFVRLGEELISTGTYEYLSSDAIDSIHHEYLQETFRLESIQEELELIEQSIHRNRNTLEKQEGKSSVQHRIHELKGEYREAMKRRSEAASVYGRYLSTGIDLSAEGLSVPDEVLDCQKRILDQQEVKKELLLMIKKLSIEKKIEEQVLLIRQDEEHINHIEQSIGQLHMQIEGIRREKSAKQDQIAHLQNQLRKVLPEKGASFESTTG